MRNFFVPFFIFLLLLMSGGSVYAQVRSSSNYSIERDSLNVGGGFSSSTNYSLESTSGDIATGDVSSTNYQARAGYQQADEPVVLSLSTSGDVSLSPSINGLTGGTSNGSTTITATTNVPAGYQLTIAASSSPAMQSGGSSLTDYTPAGSVPDATFTTGATDGHFGFSVRGVDVDTDFLVNGGVCGSGTNVAGSCWDGLSTTARVIAEGTENYPLGATTTIDFRVGVGSSASITPGVYTATTTITLLPL